MLTAEQADWVQDAIGILQVVKREGIPPIDLDAATTDLDALIEHYDKEGLGGVIGVLAAMVVDRYDEEELEEYAINAIGLRPGKEEE